MRVVTLVDAQAMDAKAYSCILQSMALHSRGIHVTMCVPEGSRLLGLAAGLEFEVRGILPHRGWLPCGLGSLRDLIDALDPTVICCHDRASQARTALAAPDRPLVRVWADIGEQDRGWLSRLVFKLTDMDVLAGRYTADELLGGLAGEAAAIPLAVDTERLLPCPSTEGSGLVLVAGNPFHRVDHRVLFEAMALLPDEVTAILLTGPEMTDQGLLLDSARSFGIEDRLLLAAGDGDAYEVYRMADIGVTSDPTERATCIEGTQMLSMGLPVLGASTCAVLDLVLDGRTGLLHAPGDHRQLARQIGYLLDNRDIVAEMGKRARNYSEEYLSLSAVGLLWEEMLGRLAM